MKNNRGKFIKQHPLTIYFVLAFVFTWLILSPGVASTLGLIDFELDGTVLTILGGLGPLLSVLVVTRATEGKGGIRKIFHSMFNLQVKVRWWAAAVLLIAGLFGISVLLGMLTGGAAPNPGAGVFLNGGNLVLVILLLLVGSFGEEPGWRGFALPKLQEKLSPMKATLILTLFWWLWHLPTYWTLPYAISAADQYGIFAAFGIQLVVLLALSILCAWVFNGSRGAVLMPVLAHFSWNFWVGAFGSEASLFLMPLFLVMVIVIGFATKG